MCKFCNTSVERIRNNQKDMRKAGFYSGTHRANGCFLLKKETTFPAKDAPLRDALTDGRALSANGA